MSSLLNRLVSSFFRPLRLLLTVGGFVFFYVSGVVLSWLVLPLMRLGARDPAARSRLSRAAAAAGFRRFHDYLHFARLIQFRPRDLAIRLPNTSQTPAVLIANHPTLIDVTAILAAQGQATCVVKRSLFHSTLIGPLLRYAWHIPGGQQPDGRLLGGTGGVGGTSDAGGHPGDVDNRHIGVMPSALKRLESGLSVLIFPEGSRSPEGGLRRFRRGAFEIASRAGVEVIPLWITCTPPVLAKEAPWYRVPPRVPQLRITPLPPLNPSWWQGDSRAMAKDVQAGYLRLNHGESLGVWCAAQPDPSTAQVDAVQAEIQAAAQAN